MSSNIDVIIEDRSRESNVEGYVDQVMDYQMESRVPRPFYITLQAVWNRGMNIYFMETNILWIPIIIS